MPNVRIVGALLLGTLGVVVGMAILLSKQATRTITSSELTEGARQATGSAQASVIVVEFSDFQCPACRAAQPELKRLISEYGGRIQFIFRHFPISTIHKNATVAAEASEVAGSLGKFWEFHDLLFERQSLWAEEDNPVALFTTWAGELGLPADLFLKKLTSKSAAEVVQKDLTVGRSIGVAATPTFFVNQEKVEISDLEVIIKRELAK